MQKDPPVTCSDIPNVDILATLLTDPYPESGCSRIYFICSGLDMFDCHNWGWWCCWHLVVEDRDAAKCRATHRTAKNGPLAQNVSSAKVKKLWSRMVLGSARIWGVFWKQPTRCHDWGNVRQVGWWCLHITSARGHSVCDVTAAFPERGSTGRGVHWGHGKGLRNLVLDTLSWKCL